MEMSAFLNLVLQPCGELCNLDCDYCYVHSMSQSENPKSPSHAANVFSAWFPDLLRKINELSIKMVRFTWHGGEPMLQPQEFFQHMVQLQNKLLRTDLARDNVLMTNGTLLNSKTVPLLSKLGISIGVSCDGPLIEHNISRVRSELEFNQIMSGFGALKGHGVDFSVVIVVNRHNLLATNDLVKMIIQLNPRFGVSITPCFGAEVSPSQQEYATFLKGLYEAWKPKKQPAISLFKNIERGLSFEPPAFCQLTGGKCGSFITVRYNGDLYTGCQVEQPYRIGNIASESISDMLAVHKRNVRLLENSLKNPTLYEFLCTEEYLYFQGRGCPFRQIESRDQYAPAIAELIEHMYRSDSARFDTARAFKMEKLLKAGNGYEQECCAKANNDY